MKIRSLYLHNFRSFREPTTINFRDEFAGEPRLITALAGTNGAGKTTVLEVIEALLAYALDPDHPPALVREAWETGLIFLEVCFDAGEWIGGSSPYEGEPVFIAAGVAEMRPAEFEERSPILIGGFLSRDRPGKLDEVRELPGAFDPTLRGARPMVGGLLYFPSMRRLSVGKPGAIEAPPEERRWLERIEDRPDWEGGLEQHWVWQNYLDLEEGREQAEHLRPAVRDVEPLLGDGRRIFIRQGRVRVSQRNDGEESVRLDQLPSGERQVLLIVGELARRRRRGLVALIDEPELSLHPTIQHALVHHLRAYARETDGQVILATHSLEIVKALPGATIFLDRLENGSAARPVVGTEAAA